MAKKYFVNGVSGKPKTKATKPIILNREVTRAVSIPEVMAFCMSKFSFRNSNQEKKDNPPIVADTITVT